VVAAGEVDAVLDEEAAEEALECGSQVGAAGVAAAEGLQDVGGTEIVVELSFGEGSEEPALLVADGKVQQGAGHRGGGEAGIAGEVAGAEAALVDRRPGGALRSRLTASSMLVGGAGMIRQRHAAVPWLRAAPSPAANKAAMRRASSVASSGACVE
jgi:hypothetical protein